MKKKTKHIVAGVLPGSIAEELEIEPGDELLSVNGESVEDVLDYRYLMSEEYVEVLLRKPDGEEWELEIEKEYEEDIGIEFENGLMDEYRTCSNKCIFCFIDQMPEGMRDTLYFKDDDARLSFLQGNYVTLTNMSDHDVERIIRYRLEPINVSFHTMNPALRCRMLQNRFAGESLKKVDRLFEAGIHMNGQIVLCKGINDGAELEYSIRRMTEYLPFLQSVSVVPVGLTRYREHLYPLLPFQKEDAREVLSLIHHWQDRIYAQYGTHFIHAGDEWYLLAQEPFPEEARYDGYLQLENGVGMMRLLMDEVEEELSFRRGDGRRHTVSVATGVLAAPTIRALARRVTEKYPGVRILVYSVQNDFFGDRITVSGLLTGQDLARQLRGKEFGERLLLPCSLVRSGEETLLDDWTVSRLEDALRTDIFLVKTGGRDLVKALLLETKTKEHFYTDEVNRYE